MQFKEIAIKKPLLLFFHEENKDKSFKSYPPKLPSIDNIHIGKDANKVAINKLNKILFPRYIITGKTRKKNKIKALIPIPTSASNVNGKCP